MSSSHPFFSLHQKSCVLPVTAVAFASVRSVRGPLVLAAEGSLIRIFCLNPPSILLTQQVGLFTGNVIHGIQCQVLDEHAGMSHHQQVRCVIWGGRRVALAQLHVTTKLDTLAVSCSSLQQGGSLDHYILDACIVTGASSATEPVSSTSVLAVTTHNVLFSFDFSIQHCAEKSPASPRLLSSGISCSLYSAHIKVLEYDNILIATGTVFGFVHIWHAAPYNGGYSTAGNLISSFSAHEGSVFGVQIFENPFVPIGGLIVASCSDDRSIKLWAVPELVTGLGMPAETRERRMSHHDAGTGFVDTSNSHGAIGGAGMANVMAHSSRIWSLRVHNRQCRQLSLISLGEDARAQVWKVMSDTTKTNSAKCDLTFSPDQVLSHHVGKNIWAGAIYEGDQVLLVTGGADGRLAMTNIRQHNTKYLWTSKNNAVSLGVASNAPSGLTISDAALGVHTEAKVNERTSRSTQLRSGNTFKSYCWLGEKTVLATTSAGNVLLGALQPKKVYTDYKHDITEHSSLLNLHVSWTGLDSLDALSSFPIIAAVPSQFALLTGAWGDVFIYLQAAGIVKPFVKLPRKVVFLAALEIVSKKDEHHSLQRKTFGAVIACQGIQFAYFVGFGIILEDIAKVQDALRQVNLPVGFLVTSVASLAANLLALGSRSGALALYDITHVQDTSVLEPASVCRQLHSESITSIHALPYDHSIYVSTTGRDSCFAVHEVSLDKSSITVQTIHRTLLPFGPCIEGAWLSPTGELLVWGFRGQELVIWNYTDRQEVMVVGCGGFRRTWSFFPHRSTAGGGSLIWTQASLCHVFYQQGASHILLQPGSHGREIKALAVRPSVGDGLGCIVATGAEDTTIRISRHCEGDANVSEQPFDTLGILRNHSTGIQKLVWSPDGTYLFSAAGKEEFYIWRVQALPYIEIGTLNVACCPQVSDDGDLRIMDLDVLEEKGADSFQKSYLIAMGYSNSSMRIWRFQPDSSTQKMQLLGTGVYSTVCLTQCHFVWFGLEPFILTCATDGRIALWRIGEVILRNNSAAADREAPSPSAGNLTSRLSEASPLASSQPVFHPLTSAAVHQSSIKSLAFARLSPTSTLIVTGGDDNALGFSLVSMLRDSRGSGMFAKFAALLVPKAHASAINALSLAEISAELGSSEPNSKSSFEEQASTGGLCSFRLVSASNDQRLITWDVRVELSAARSSSATGSVHSDFLGTELIHVFRNTSGRSLVADVDCMDTIQAPYQHPKGHKVILAGVGLEIWDIATNTREKYDAT